MRNMVIGLVVFAAALGIALSAAYLVYTKWAREQTNPYAFDISSLTTTDSNLVKYTQASAIALDDIHATALALGPDGSIAVAGDSLDIFSSAGVRIGGFGLSAQATCLAIASNGTFFVGVGDHIEVYNPTGALTHIWAAPGTNSLFTSIAVRGDDVYAADAGGHVVWRYDATGAVQQAIGRKDIERGIPGFLIPSPYFDLAIAANGSLWVVNPGMHQLENYTRNGDMITSWRRSGTSIDGFCGCCNPSHFALMADGSFVTAEKGIVRVKVMDPKGTFVCLVAGPGEFEEGTVGLDVAVDAQQRVLVLDPMKGIVRVFARK